MEGCTEKVKGLREKLTDTDNSTVITGVVGGIEGGKGGINGDGRRLDLGWQT